MSRWDGRNIFLWKRKKTGLDQAYPKLMSTINVFCHSLRNYVKMSSLPFVCFYSHALKKWGYTGFAMFCRDSFIP